MTTGVKILGAGSFGDHLAHACRGLGWKTTLCDVDPAAQEHARTLIYPQRYGTRDAGRGGDTRCLHPRTLPWAQHPAALCPAGRPRGHRRGRRHLDMVETGGARCDRIASNAARHTPIPARTTIWTRHIGDDSYCDAPAIAEPDAMQRKTILESW